MKNSVITTDRRQWKMKKTVYKMFSRNMSNRDEPVHILCAILNKMQSRKHIFKATNNRKY